MSDLLLVLVFAVGCCVATGGVGLALLHALRRHRITVLIVVAALVPVVAVAATVLLTVQAMFISGHDSQVVLICLGASTVLGVGLAVLVGRRLAAASRELSRGVRELGSGPGAAAPATVHAPAELAELVAELEATRERLSVSHQRERALETSRRELVAFMSHDLRSPLSGLRAIAEGLEDGVIEDVPAALVQVQASVDRMSTLVDDLFEVSRLHGEPAARPRSLVSLREVAEDVAGECAEQARAAQVDLRVDVGDDRLPVLASADELARALANLISNAVRHTGPGGRVEVRGTRGVDGRVLVSVQDGCGGIDPGDLDRLFDIGWRGEVERTPGDGRTGLGLAIARGVVEAHAGSLEVANVNGGCRFEVALPVAGPASASPPPARRE